MREIRLETRHSNLKGSKGSFLFNRYSFLHKHCIILSLAYDSNNKL